MSRDWTEREYVPMEAIFCWIDEELQDTYRLLEEAKDAGSETQKMVLFGKREMLRRLGDYAREYETTLGELASFWGLSEDLTP